MKKFLLAVVIVAALVAVLQQRGGMPQLSASAPPAGAQADRAGAAFSEHDSGEQVTGTGTVARLLPDDDQGSRHQRFIVRLASGQSILIAHNIDLAPRVSPLARGDVIEFNGVFVWNAKGGVVHWTHRDPSGRHPAGWLRHDGQTFQ